MDYREYKAEDLLLDPSFCNYCGGRDREAILFWEEWIAAHPENKDSVREAKELYYLLNGNLRPAQYLRDEQAFRDRMEEHFQREQPLREMRVGSETRRTLPRKILLYTGAAAALLILVIGMQLYKGRTVSRSIVSPVPAEYSQNSKTGERKSFTLADGTRVMLNAGSMLKTAKAFNFNVREIWLEGEAYFDVAHDAGKPFIIHTSSMDIKVLGTVFNVRDYPSDKVTEASLLKGSVAVIVKGASEKEIILHPNEKIVLSNEKPVVSSVLSAKSNTALPGKKYKIASLTYNSTDSSLVETSWTENRLAFNETSFEEIAVQLERWYNISVHFDNEEVKQYRYTATFDKNTLPQVLNALQLSRHFDYEIKGDKQIIIK